MEREENTHNQAETRKVLVKLRNEVFEGSDMLLAQALGRPLEEVESWQRETEDIDEDAEMKIHGIAEERLGK